jgi:hypothetical protein
MDRAPRALLWLACFVAALAPLVAVVDMPLIDLPNHLAHANMWLHWDDPAWGFQECYTFELRPLPYVVYHGFLRVLGEVVSIQVANKLWMALSIVGLGGAMAYLLRALDRPPVLALAALPLYWSGSTLWGFLNFMGSQTVLVLALGLIAANRFWLGAIAGASLYFLHPLGLAAFIGMAPIVAPGLWRRVVVVLPAAALFVIGMTLAPADDLTPRTGLRLEAVWWSLGQSWQDFPRLVFAFVNRTTALVLLGEVVILVVATGFLVDRRGGRPDPRPLLLFVIACLYYLALPRNMQAPMDLAGISSRFAPFVVWTALLLVPRGALTPLRSTLVLVAVLALNLWHGNHVATKLARGARDDQAFHHVVDRVPARTPALVVFDDRSHPAYPELNHPRLHQQALVQLARGGFDPQGWGPPFPILAKPECKARYPELDRSFAWEIDWQTHWPAYDWFLVRGDGLLVFRDHPVVLVAKDGAWSLWRKR